MRGPNFPPLVVGSKIGDLTIISIASRPAHIKKSGRWYSVACVCGEPFVVRGDRLKTGETRSCGCISGELISRAAQGNTSPVTHGMTGAATHKAWLGMMRRAHWKSTQNSRRYSDRGIAVCDRWANSFVNFLEDMGERPPGMTLDRINNDGNYEPGNCRWASQKTQQNNRSTNHLIEHLGEIKTIAGWAESAGLRRALVSARINRGESIEEALRPSRSRR